VRGFLKVWGMDGGKCGVCVEGGVGILGGDRVDVESIDTWRLVVCVLGDWVNNEGLGRGDIHSGIY
jgi:hypothetical protein